MSRSTWSLPILALTLLIPRAHATIGCGDLNSDGKVNVSDATLALRMAVGLVTPTADQKRLGDLNQDGKVNVIDATLLLRAAVGISAAAGCASSTFTPPYIVTVVGDPDPMANGALSAARFQLPSSVSADAQGNIYVADLNNHAIRMISAAGQVTTLAGNGVAGYKDGDASSAQLGDVRYVAVGSDGTIYFSDSSNDRIRTISPDHSTVSTLAGNPSLDANGYAIGSHVDGPGNKAQFYYPWGLALDKSGNLYVADPDDNEIRKIAPDADHTVSTFAGTGQNDYSDGSGDPLSAAFSSPVGLAVSPAGDVFISDWGNEMIRAISASGVMSTLSGNPVVSGGYPQPGFEDGAGDVAQFGSPWGVTYVNGTLYVADSDYYYPDNGGAGYQGSRIRAVDSTGTVKTIAGGDVFGIVDGPGAQATFHLPEDVTSLSDGTLYVADTYNNAIRKITPDGAVSSVTGQPPGGYVDGAGKDARLLNPEFITGDGNGNFYIADYGNNRIRKLSSDGTISTVIGQAYDANKVGGYQDGPIKAAKIDGPTSVAVATDGSIYFTDRENHVIRKISADGSAVTTFAGTAGQSGYLDGPGSKAQFNRPRYIEFGPDGYLYVSDTINNRIRKIAPDGTVSTVAGDGNVGYKDGAATAAEFGYPQGFAIASDGTIYVSDFQNQMIRKIDPKGNVTTLAGNPPLDSSGNPQGGYQDGAGDQAEFDTPGALLLLSDGSLLLADRFNNRIRKIATDGTVSTVAGLNDSGFWDGSTTIARLDGPFGLALDKDGSILISEENNHRIRRLVLQ